MTEVQVLLSALRIFKAPALFKELWTVGVGGGRATPYNDLTGRLCTKGYLFHASGIRKFRDLTGKRVEKSVISVCKLAQKG